MAEIYCEPCRKNGHLCLASNVIEGETPKCIFCEDNEPCPHAKQKPSQAPAALSGDSIAKHVAMVERANRQVKQSRKRHGLQIDLERAGVPRDEAIQQAEREVPAITVTTCSVPDVQKFLDHGGAQLITAATKQLNTPCKEGTMELCKCGKPLRHIGRCKGIKIAGGASHVA